MKFKLLSLSLFSLSALSPIAISSLTHPAMAGCVAVDVGTQVAVDGHKGRGNQTNNVNQNFGPNCRNSVGGTVTSVGNQVCHSGTCAQSRTSNQYADGNPNYRTGVNTKNIGIRVNPQIHVYDVSKDPNFFINRR
ncbi:MAG: hypothetical protein DSM106950_32680 [Stigonema ocellatum SAG 48.90 = DSM 106950]|nr:hypothetical protein [Stigonema ocellatum SAG 48.90 = DSM 106950]